MDENVRNKSIPKTNDTCDALVTVIITCYNHGLYLENAIRSALEQKEISREIIVVDDGSSDNTAQVSKDFPEVRYIHQLNQGVSAARNTGVKHSRGRYIVFLDADDWLLPHALVTNVDYLLQDKKAGLVAGAYFDYIETEKKKILRTVNESTCSYEALLAKNIIGMHAAVMYPRWIFQTVEFDTSLRFCEDWDIYLNIARNYITILHTTPVAVYRRHFDSMSNNTLRMIESGLSVLKRQKGKLNTNFQRKQLISGRRHILNVYTRRIYNTVTRITLKEAKGLLLLDGLWRYNKSLLAKSILVKGAESVSTFLKKTFLPRVFIFLNAAGIFRSHGLNRRKIRFGDFKRLQPFSKSLGANRGGALDRFFIENFLESYRSLVRGRVLEIGDNIYTLRFAGSKMSKSDILHLDDTNPKATFFGDLSNCPTLPSDAFDCIILTQTLQYVYDAKSAIQTCYRILKPGGVLLLAVPGISPISRDAWADKWCWMFTQVSLKKMLCESFAPEDIVVQSFGNVCVAATFLYGVGVPELNQEQLNYHDPYYPIVVTGKASKRL